MLPVVSSWTGFSADGRVSCSARLAVSGDKRLTVSMLIPASRHSCANDQWFSRCGPSSSRHTVTCPALARGARTCGKCQRS